MSSAATTAGADKLDRSVIITGLVIVTGLMHQLGPRRAAGLDERVAPTVS